jgi:thioredoxin 1
MSEQTQNIPHAPAVTKLNFEEVVLKSDIPVLVDFWAPWCGPCRAIGPSIDQLAHEYEGRAKVVKLDVDDEAEIESRYGVKSIPTLIFFKNGEVADTLIGAYPKPVIAGKLDALI